MPEDQQGGSTATTAAGDAVAPAVAAALSPEQIRSTPEFRALEEQNRTLARQAGAARAEVERQRQAAEQARQAAEAQRVADQAASIAAVLDDRGRAAWDEIATLSQTDPVAAARKFAELTKAQAAQSAAPNADATTTAQASATGETTVAGPASTESTPPPPPSGVSGAAPLTPASTDDDVPAIIESLTKTYGETVARVQDPVTRNRVTMRDRGDAFISFLGAAYLKAGARARSK